jgi:hypothetical protein
MPEEDLIHSFVTFMKQQRSGVVCRPRGAIKGGPRIQRTASDPDLEKGLRTLMFSGPMADKIVSTLGQYPADPFLENRLSQPCSTLVGQVDF